MFDPNNSFMFVLVGGVILFVLAQSGFFLLKALRRAKELGIDKSAVKNTILSSGVFTIAPAVAILLGVIALSKSLGLAFPWLRLSVIGSLTYETSAAATAANALGESLSNTISDPLAFSAIAWVVTIGSLFALLLVVLFTKRIETGLDKLRVKDKKWGDIFQSGLFLGMISAFLGVVFADVRTGIVGWIPVFVMLISAVIMAVCGLLYNKTKKSWITDYALPVCMLGAMALSIPLNNLIAG